MAAIDELVNALQETTIAREIAIPQDEARARYPISSNTVRDWRAFEDIISDYYAYHDARCVGRGGWLSRAEALGKAKDILEREYRRRRTDIAGAFADARDGTNNGLRGVLDVLADGIKADSVRHYMTFQFDNRVGGPNDFEARVEMIRQFFARFGAQLAGPIQTNRPERYANDFRSIIEAYIQGLQTTSAIFRRL